MPRNGLTDYPSCEYNLSMVGKIRTKEKCPKCKGKFVDKGHAFECPQCMIPPKRYFIDVFWHKRYKIYSDKDGRVLTSYDLANRVLAEIRQAVDRRTFDPGNYVAVKLKALEFEHNILEWLKRQEIRKESNEIAPSYYEKVRGMVNKYLHRH
ncbi:MAG: hypothetical protein ACMUJM_17990 [bacterium]